jgi:hypothetical protein
MIYLAIDGKEVTSGEHVYVHNFTSIFDSAPQNIQTIDSTTMGGSIFTKKHRTEKRFRVSLNLSFPTVELAQAKAMEIQSFIEQTNLRNQDFYETVPLVLSGFGENVYMYNAVLTNVQFDQNHYNTDFYERINIDFLAPRGYGFLSGVTYTESGTHTMAASSGVIQLSGFISGVSRVTGSIIAKAPPSVSPLTRIRVTNLDTGRMIDKEIPLVNTEYTFDFERMNLFDLSGNVERSKGEFSNFLTNSISGYEILFVGGSGVASGSIHLSGIV